MPNAVYMGKLGGFLPSERTTQGEKTKET